MYQIPFDRMIFKIMLPALWDTLWMMFGSFLICFALGLFFAIVLARSGPGGLSPNRTLYEMVSTIMGLVYAVPYVILAIALVPITRALIGTSIGVGPAIFTIGIGATPWIARLLETAFKEVSPALIEAAKSFGATNMQITFKVLIVEAIPAIISQMTLAVIVILGFTAIAGTIGAGGLGGVALTYGYQNFNSTIMYGTVLIMIVIVVLIQLAGNALYKRLK